METDLVEFYTTTEYDGEIDRIIALDRPNAAVGLYHSLSRAVWVDGEETASEEGYARLCNYIAENFAHLDYAARVSVHLTELQDATCSLVQRTTGELWKAGTHFFDGASHYLKIIEDAMMIDFSVESWEVNASTN